MGAAMLLAWPLGVKLTLFDRSILWSLVAELVYYLLYPVFRLIRSRVSWFRIIVAALLGSFAVAASAPMALDYPSFGNGLNWLLGLPCWLLGCLMAESDWSRWQNSSAAGMAELWFIRGSIVVTAMILSVARFHLDLGYPWTLNLFAIGVYFWLRREIAEYNIRPGYENRRLILDPLGKVSYSIYLTHVLSVRLSEQLLLGLDQSEAVTWFAGFLIMTAVAFLFYISVERPSHLFARRIGLLVGR